MSFERFTLVGWTFKFDILLSWRAVIISTIFPVTTASYPIKLILAKRSFPRLMGLSIETRCLKRDRSFVVLLHGRLEVRVTSRFLWLWVSDEGGLRSQDSRDNTFDYIRFCILSTRFRRKRSYFGLSLTWLLLGIIGRFSDYRSNSNGEISDLGVSKFIRKPSLTWVLCHV